MKKKYLFLPLLIILFIAPKAEASHIYGGEISWKCLNNGEYVFYMSIYRDCTGASWPYRNASLQIFGSPLPRDSNNQTIGSIILTPDSTLWLQKNKGDLATSCENPNAQFSCNSRDPGVVQAFYYKSAPIVLNGTPPANGWRIVFEPPCCRPTLHNTSTGGTPFYEAIMYAHKDTTKIGCINNASLFTENITSAFCRETTQQTLNYTATAVGADSITYHWEQSWNTPAANPSALNYAAGYSMSNPLPDTSFDINNQAAKLDRKSGVIDFATFSGGPHPRKYLTVVRADAWKDGERYASSKRELPIVLFSCSTLANNQMNRPPNFSFDGQQQKNYEIQIKAGDKLSIPIQLKDLDSTDNGNSLQKVRLLSYDAYALANDRVDTSACDQPPCAVFENNIPQYDSSLMAYKLGDTTSINTTFSWQTDCNHLQKDGSTKTYYFYLYGQDLVCPWPATVGSYLKVTVEPLAFRGIRSQSGTLMTVDSLPNYQWYDCDADTLITNETNREFTPNRNGNFAVITSLNNCIDTSACFFYYPVGIDKMKLENQFHYYPNPTNGQMTIAFKSNKESIQLNVYNIYGQIVQTQKFVNVSNANFEIDGAAGIYILELVDRKGEKANFKVLKK